MNLLRSWGKISVAIRTIRKEFYEYTRVLCVNIGALSTARSFYNIYIVFPPSFTLWRRPSTVCHVHVVCSVWEREQMTSGVTAVAAGFKVEDVLVCPALHAYVRVRAGTSRCTKHERSCLQCCVRFAVYFVCGIALVAARFRVGNFLELGVTVSERDLRWSGSLVAPGCKLTCDRDKGRLKIQITSASCLNFSAGKKKNKWIAWRLDAATDVLVANNIVRSMSGFLYQSFLYFTDDVYLRKWQSIIFSVEYCDNVIGEVRSLISRDLAWLWTKFQHPACAIWTFSLG